MFLDGGGGKLKNGTAGTFNESLLNGNSLALDARVRLTIINDLLVLERD